MSNYLVVVNLEEHPELTLEEVCHAYNITSDMIMEMIEYGAIDSARKIGNQAYFNEVHLRRIRMMTHLINDLNINIPGAALVLDLMEERERMHHQIELLEKYLGFNPDI